MKTARLLWLGSIWFFIKIFDGIEDSIESIGNLATYIYYGVVDESPVFTSTPLSQVIHQKVFLIKFNIN